MRISACFEGVLALLLPAQCAACGARCDDTASFCLPCAATLERIRNACPRCGLPLPPSSRSLPCNGCLRAPPPWDGATVGYVYGGALAEAVRRWKLGRRPELTGALSRLLEPAMATLSTEVTALVPVPLHPRRLRAREFDQAALLARAARRQTSPPVARWLRRQRDTPSQATLAKAAREHNLRDAFMVAAPQAVRGAHLCLVDDLLTTGATLGECARTLLRAGAARVDVLTLARVLP